MTDNIPKICAAFEMWQNNDSIKASTTLELMMRYLADDPEIDVVVSSNDQDRAYLDYIIRQNEIINAKTLLIQELNMHRVVDKTTIDEFRDKNTDDKTTIEGLLDNNTRIKADLASVKSDRDIMFDNYRNTKHKLQTDVRGLEAELSARKEDSAMLMKVVEIIKDESVDNNRAAYLISAILADCLDVPEGPPETPIDDLYTTTFSIFLEMP